MCKIKLGIILSLMTAIGCVQHVDPHVSEMLDEAFQAYQQGQDIEAIVQADQLIEHHPRSPQAAEAHYIRGLSYLRRGNYAAAEADFERSLQLSRRDDLSGRASLALGLLAESRGDWNLAMEHYGQATEALSADAEAGAESRYRLADLLQRQDQWDRADLQFDRILHLHHDSQWAGFARQRIRARAWTIETGRFAEAEAAEQQVGLLQEAGLDAALGPVLANGMAYAVQSGRFETYAQAVEALHAVAAVVDNPLIATTR